MMTRKLLSVSKMALFAGDLKTTRTIPTQFQKRFYNIEKNTQKFKKILFFLMIRRMNINQIKEKAQ